MEQGGAPANDNHPSQGPQGFQPMPPRRVGQAEAFRGGFNGPYQGYGGGSYGRRGGANIFHPPPMVGDLVCMPYHNGVGSKALDIHKLEAFHHSRLMVRDRVRMSPFL
jgi:hypothetical protein